MKFRLNLANPSKRERAQRNSAKKECVQFCTEDGVSRIEIAAVPGGGFAARIVTGTGDLFEVTEADNDDMRVLAGAVMRSAKGCASEDDAGGDDEAAQQAEAPAAAEDDEFGGL